MYYRSCSWGYYCDITALKNFVLFDDYYFEIYKESLDELDHNYDYDVFCNKYV